MCFHLDTANQITDKIINDIYFNIETQISLIDSSRYLTGNDNMSRIYTNLKAEIGALAAFERDVAFPSILQVFDSKDATLSDVPNLNELNETSIGKERQILKLANELETEYRKANHLNSALEKLLILIQFEFTAAKAQWQKMTHNWQSGCECFQRINNLQSESLKN